MGNKTNPYKIIADKIHQHADRLLDIKKISSMLKEMGEFYFIGSYALDLMTWNDIDMQLIVNEDVFPLDAAQNILSKSMHDIESQNVGRTADPTIHMSGFHRRLPNLGSHKQF